MTRFKAILISFAAVAALTVSAAALTLTPQNSNQNASACCDMANCCKDAAMSCCKKKRKGKNAHACCKGKTGAESCCCKGDSCPMPNKKATNTNTN